MTTGKTIALTRHIFVGKVMSLFFNTLSRLVITFLPRSKRLLISWLQWPCAVILEPRKIKSATVSTISTVSPSICHEVMGPDAMILVFWMLSFKPTFSLSSFTFIKRLLSSSSLSAIRVVSSGYLRLLIFLLASSLKEFLVKQTNKNNNNKKTPLSSACRPLSTDHKPGPQAGLGSPVVASSVPSYQFQAPCTNPQSGQATQLGPFRVTK